MDLIEVQAEEQRCEGEKKTIQKPLVVFRMLYFIEMAKFKPISSNWFKNLFYFLCKMLKLRSLQYFFVPLN